MATSETGVSAENMRRELGIKDYKTVWVLAHKIRTAMENWGSEFQLAGLVVLDESVLNKISSKKKDEESQSRKPVIVAVSEWEIDGKEGVALTHAFSSNDLRAETIEMVLRQKRVPGQQVESVTSAIRRDGWSNHEVTAEGFGYRAVRCSEVDTSDIPALIDELIGNAKRFFSGVCREISRKHLPRYLSEVCWRFNRKFRNLEVFDRLLAACVCTDAVTGDELMSTKSN